MIIDISELEENKPVDIKIDEDFAELNAHAKGMLNLKSGGDFVFVRGNLEVNIDIDEKYFKGAETPVTSKEHQLKAKDFAQELDGCEEIDLSDLIYQSIIINIPSQTLCNENCKGIKELEKYIKADENLQRIEIPLIVKNKENK